jgi:hypothetical protein
VDTEVGNANLCKDSLISAVVALGLSLEAIVESLKMQKKKL